MQKEKQLAALERLFIAAANTQGVDVRDTFVSHYGNPDAGIAIIGEAPNSAEEAAQKLFVGAAGDILKDALVLSGLTHRKVYMTAVMKFRPQTPNPDKNRPPKWRELHAFRKVLLKELAIVQPKVIICLGASALRAVLDQEDLKIGGQIGLEYSMKGMSIVGAYHPSYILKSGGKTYGDGKPRFAYRVLCETIKWAVRKSKTV